MSKNKEEVMDHLTDVAAYVMSIEEYRKLWNEIDERFENEFEERLAIKKYEEEYNV